LVIKNTLNYLEKRFIKAQAYVIKSKTDTWLTPLAIL